MKITKTFLAALTALGLTSLAAQPSAVAASSDPITLRVEVDRGVLPANTHDRAIVKIAIDGCRPTRREARPPVNLAIVLDRSGSMSGHKIEDAKYAAIEALRHLSPEDIFSLVVFDGDVETLIPATRVGSNTRMMENRIRQINVRGSTALFAGVSQGASEVRKYVEDSRYVHRIILLSDGQANVGPRTPAELGRLGTALMKEGVSVTTIGLGLGYDEDLMTRLALKSDGNTYFVENSGDLANIFDAELGDVLNIVARRAVVTIEFPEGVRPIRFVGREGIIRGQNAELTLNQIYGGQQKYALVEIETPSARPNTEREIARAQLTFEDAVTRRSATLSSYSRVRFSDDEAVVVKSANSRVQADYADNRIAETKDIAVALADKGQTAEAAKIMKQETAALADYSVKYDNAEVRSKAAEISLEAADMDANGMSDAKRKTYRTQSTNAVMQQRK